MFIAIQVSGLQLVSKRPCHIVYVTIFTQHRYGPGSAVTKLAPSLSIEELKLVESEVVLRKSNVPRRNALMS